MNHERGSKRPGNNKIKNFRNKEEGEIEDTTKNLVALLTIGTDRTNNTTINPQGAIEKICTTIYRILTTNAKLDPNVEQKYGSSLKDLYTILYYLRAHQGIYKKIMNVEREHVENANQNESQKKQIWDAICKHLNETSQKDADGKGVLEKRMKMFTDIPFQSVNILQAKGFSAGHYMIYNMFSNIIFAHMLQDLFGYTVST